MTCRYTAWKEQLQTKTSKQTKLCKNIEKACCKRNENL